MQVGVARLLIIFLMAIFIQRGLIVSVLIISVSNWICLLYTSTPLTAIVLITEITGHFEVFYPSIVVGGLTYYFTELLQIKPYNVLLMSLIHIYKPDTKGGGLS